MCDAKWQGGIRCEDRRGKNRDKATRVLGLPGSVDQYTDALTELVLSDHVDRGPSLGEVLDTLPAPLSLRDRDEILQAAAAFRTEQAVIKADSAVPGGTSDDVKATLTARYADAAAGVADRCRVVAERMHTPHDVALYEVGGYVRDGLLGKESKDIDFAVTAPSYEAMREFLQDAGFEIFLENPEFLTIRARFPREVTHPAIPEKFTKVKRLPTADFVLARRDGGYTDGRRPDEVYAGSLQDDLARRDFTVNAIARDKDGRLLDPHGGQADLEAGVLRAVGDPEVRFREDALRALRAVRFMVTKGLDPDVPLWDAMSDTEWLPGMLAAVSAERRREELDKAFHVDTLATLDLLRQLPHEFSDAVFSGGLRLQPTMAK